MSELDEIMEGKHEIKHLHIEGDTIAFETELNNHTWNLTPRDIEIIIYCLQQENKQLKEQLEYLRSNEYLNQVKWERNFNEKLVKDLQGKIDILIEDNSQLEEIRIKAIEYNKEVLTWITNEPITDEIAYKNLEILGDKANE